VARYSLPVRLVPYLLHAGLFRRSDSLIRATRKMFEKVVCGRVTGNAYASSSRRLVPGFPRHITQRSMNRETFFYTQ